MIRNIRESDSREILPVVDAWWGGRRMRDMLPHLFFEHFQETSFVIEDDRSGKVIAFLVGFVSQTHPEEAYIHFVGVHPDFRGRGLGRELYSRFFTTVAGRGCRRVRCVTSPVNKGSIAFHLRLGFRAEAGDAAVDGVPVVSDLDAPGQSRVRFVTDLPD